MKLIKIVCLLFLVAASKIGLAQNAPRLTLKEAVELALKNNYNIRLAQNNNTIAKNNVTIGNAGILPVVTGDLSTNASKQTIQQTRSDGTVNNLNGISNSNNSYGPSLNWTIFDGFAMFANYDLLKQQNQLSDLRLRDTIQSTMADVIATYYNLINQNAQLRAQKGVIEISRTQVRIANDKFTVGRAAKLEVLNAQVNLNTDTAALISLEQQYNSTKIRLNQLLVRDLQSDFSVADTIIVDEKLKLADVINNAQTKNPAILSAEINKRVADITLKQIRSTRYPVLSVGTGYTWTNSKTPAGFTQRQNAHGFNYGLTASVNIFDGFNQWRRERNAKISIDNAGINAKQVRLDVEAQISDLFVSYLSGLQLVKIGDANVTIAKRNLEITLDKYKLGNITPLEVREAQRNYLTATSTFFSAEYQSKLAEITLKQITNSINIE